jgi:hypothetical protein
MAEITITGDVSPDKLADVLAQQLLVTVREIGGDREGEYSFTARLNTDGSYHWNWNWYPASAKMGGSAGKGRLGNGVG